MDDLLAEASMTPGVLTLRAAVAARAADGEAALTLTHAVEDGADPDGTDPSVRAGTEPERGVDTLPDHVAERAAGVQLIYEGLRLIRRLAGDDPWTPVPGATDTDHTDENLAVLAADVLVSRGFYLLARTAAADRAVQTVRNFGRDQTLARSGAATTAGERTDAPDGEETTTDPDHSLEVDVLRLALVAGGTCAESVSPAAGALSAVTAVVRSSGSPFPPAETSLADVNVGTTPPGVGVDGEGSTTHVSTTDTRPPTPRDRNR